MFLDISGIKQDTEDVAKSRKKIRKITTPAIERLRNRRLRSLVSCRMIGEPDTNHLSNVRSW